MYLFKCPGPCGVPFDLPQCTGANYGLGTWELLHSVLSLIPMYLFLGSDLFS